MKTICRKMNEEIISLRNQIHDNMMKKFGMEIDFDEMEEAILIRMIAKQTKTNENDHQTQIELGKLKVHLKVFNFLFDFNKFFFNYPQRKMEAKNQELLTIKQKQVEKYNLLIVLQEELNSIHAEQKYHEKLHKKHSLAGKYDVGDTKDLERLQEISKRQKQQIKQITREIQTLRSKVKPKDQFKLHERVQQERNSPQMMTIPEFIGNDDDDAHLMRSQSLDSFLSNAPSDP